MSVRSYDPKMILTTVGALPMTGFADGTFLKVEMNEDAFSLQVGADGEAARSRSNNNSAKITITLLQTSPANDLLSALYASDRLIPGRTGIVPLMIKDLLGTTLFAAVSCWITKVAPAEYAKEAGSREWVLETDDLQVAYVGGSI